MLASEVKKSLIARKVKVTKAVVRRAISADEGSQALALHKVENTTQILKMRRAGHSVEEISAALDFTEYYVATCIKDAIKMMREQFRESIEDIREIELQRLDELQTPFYRKAKTGDDWALQSVMKIMDRRTKLLGMDAATKLEHTGEIVKQYVGINIDAI